MSDDTEKLFDLLLQRVDEIRDGVPDGLDETAKRIRLLAVVKAQREVAQIVTVLSVRPRAHPRLQVLADQLEMPALLPGQAHEPDDAGPTLPVIRPPGETLERWLRACMPTSAFDLYIAPGLADAQHEYLEARRAGRPWFARWRFAVGLVWLVKPWAWATWVAKVVAWFARSS